MRTVGLHSRAFLFHCHHRLQP